MLELLVVLAVMSAVLGLLAGQFDARPARQDELEAKRIEQLLRDAVLGAMGDGRERWLQTAAPDRLQVRVSDGVIAEMGLKRTQWQRWIAADAAAPQLRFHGDGSVTPGELVFAVGGQRRGLQVDWHGALRWRDAAP